MFAMADRLPDGSAPWRTGCRGTSCIRLLATSVTKRRVLVRTLAAGARGAGLPFGVAREGGRHTIFFVGSTLIPVPRHAEINEVVTIAIYKEASVELGKDWWK